MSRTMLMLLASRLLAGGNWVELNERGKRLAESGDLAAAETALVAALGQADSTRTRGLTLCSLACLYHARGDNVRADELLSEATPLLNLLPRGDAESAVTCKQSHAIIKRRLGQFEQSLRIHHETRQLAQTEFGLRHKLTARAFHNLAMVELDLGRLADAELHLKQSIELNEACCGSLNPEAVGSLSQLGEIYRVRGDSAKAEATLRRALHLAEAIDPHGVKVAVILDYLARLQYHAGSLDEAERNWKRSLAIHRIDNPTSTAVVLLRLAEVERFKKRYRDSEALLQKAVSLLETSGNQAYLATAFSALAGLYLDERNIERAEVLYRRALALAEREFGPNNPQVGATLHGLSRALIARKAYKEAEAPQRRAIEILQLYYGPGHRELLAPLGNYAHLLRKLRRGNEASALETRIRQIHADSRPAKLNTVDVRDLALSAR